MPVGSTTVTWASRRSSLLSRLATSVPPTPPPRTTMRAGMASPRLADEVARVAVLVDDLDQLVLGLGHPRGDVGARARVAGPHLDDVTEAALADGADQREQRAGAGHAACVDELCRLCRRGHVVVLHRDVASVR